jgi:hypothetical protein
MKQKMYVTSYVYVNIQWYTDVPQEYINIWDVDITQSLVKQYLLLSCLLKHFLGLRDVQHDRNISNIYVVSTVTYLRYAGGHPLRQQWRNRRCRCYGTALALCRAPLPRQWWCNKRCRCYGNRQIYSLPPSTVVTWRRFPLWRNTLHHCWLRQQATV